jgi:hypothetical protein
MVNFGANMRRKALTVPSFVESTGPAGTLRKRERRECSHITGDSTHWSRCYMRRCVNMRHQTPYQSLCVMALLVFRRKGRWSW